MFYWVLQGFIEVSKVSLGFIGFYRVLLGFHKSKFERAGTKRKKKPIAFVLAVLARAAKSTPKKRDRKREREVERKSADLEKTLEKTDSEESADAGGGPGLFSRGSDDRLSPIQTNGYDNRFSICENRKREKQTPKRTLGKRHARSTHTHEPQCCGGGLW